MLHKRSKSLLPFGEQLELANKFQANQPVPK